MERLNDILGRTPRHRQQDAEQRNNTSSQSQRPGMPPSRYPLREQTAHLGPASRSVQSQYQHKFPPHVRNEQGTRSAYARQQQETNGSSRALPYQQRPSRQVDVDNHPQYDEFASDRERSWRSPGIASSDSVDSYSTTSGADVREEWEDDTVGMRYGDWEDEGRETYT